MRGRADRSIDQQTQGRWVLQWPVAPPSFRPEFSLLCTYSNDHHLRFEQLLNRMREGQNVLSVVLFINTSAQMLIGRVSDK